MRILLLVSSIACSGSPDGTAAIPTPPESSLVPEPAPPPWQTTGDFGDLLFLRHAENRAGPQTLSVAAVFADDLQDKRYAAGCAPGIDLCLDADMPREVVFDEAGTLDLDQSAFRWVGDRVSVGDLAAPFEAAGTPAYLASEPVLGLLQFDYPLHFEGGEWDPVSVEGAVTLPTSLKVLEPDPNDMVLAPSGLQPIRWIPEGGEDLVLTVTADNIHTTRLLEDDGEAWLNFDDYRVEGALDVTLSRVTSPTTLDVDGNRLTIRSVAQQSWCIAETCDPPFDGTTLLSFDFCWSALNCGSSRFQLNADGTWETVEGFIGEWVWDCCTNTLEVIFTTGTVYSASLEPDGCFDGEMMSWSGSTGTWSGCL